MRALQVGSLIGRSEMHVVQPAAAEVLAGKRVLVTGAGGSIGSELCRQVWGFGPEQLVMLDHDESNLHRLQLEMWGSATMDADEVVVADIRDPERIHQIFREYRPQVVFHAAALKHLPALERHPCEGVKSNVWGTDNLVEAAIVHDVERFVLISTDKAANPTSVLGATKRAAELVLQRHRGSWHPAVCGPLRQRARQPRVVAARAARAARLGDAGDGHPPRRHALLHDHRGGGRPGPRGGPDGRRAHDVRARHGRAGADRRAGRQLRAPPQPGPRGGALHRAPPRREAEPRSCSARTRPRCPRTTRGSPGPRRRSRPPASAPRSSTCTTPRRTTGPTRCASTCVDWCPSTPLPRRPCRSRCRRFASPYPDDY